MLTYAELLLSAAIYKAGLLNALHALQYRTSRDFRDPNFLGPRIGDKLLVAIILMTLYVNQGTKTDQQGVLNTVNMLFMWCASARPKFPAHQNCWLDESWIMESCLCYYRCRRWARALCSSARPDVIHAEAFAATGSRSLSKATVDIDPVRSTWATGVQVHPPRLHCDQLRASDRARAPALHQVCASAEISV